MSFIQIVPPLDPVLFEDVVRRALVEDVGTGDITTAAVAPPDARADAFLIAKQRCVLSGMDVAREVFRQVDADVQWIAARHDGDVCQAGVEIARVNGSAAAILVAERTALNFLQYLSGIATLTREYVGAARGAIKILDTRKTTPTLRVLAKYAVRCGGGSNHRVGLYDGILIKDNHIRLAGSVGEAIRRVRARHGELPIEVEAQSLEEVDEALVAGADVIMLDNFDDARVQAVVRRIGGRARIELSGGMTLERVGALAASGADEVSIGALTHSTVAVDISLEIEIDVRSATR